jgi:hypothetical protein
MMTANKTYYRIKDMAYCRLQGYSLTFFVFLVSIVGGVDFNPRNPKYTGLIRQIGDSSSYVVSFDPAMTEILLAQCISAKAGYASYVSNQGTTPTTYYSCVLQYNERSPAMSNPILGASSYSSINNIWFHINGEDGFASAYTTAVDLLISPEGESLPPKPKGSCGQQTICGKASCSKPDTPFIITGSHYNRASLSILATVTYANGNHWLVSIESNNTAQATCSNPQPDSQLLSQPTNALYLRNILQLNATGVIPAISGFDQLHLYYVMVIIRGGRALLTATTIGMDQNGKSTLDPAAVLWETDVTKWTLTSLEVDGPHQKIHFMAHNASGHFLVTADVMKGSIIGSQIFVESSDTRVAYGLSALAPLKFGFPDALEDKGKLDSQLSTYSYFTRMRSNSTVNISGSLNSVSWNPALRSVEMNPVLQSFATAVPPGKTFLSLESRFTTIPTARIVFPTFAHVVGGALVKIEGGPFIDSPALSCMWTVIDCYWWIQGQGRSFAEECTYVSRRETNNAFYTSSDVMLCVTPSVSRPLAARLQVSLNGIVWSNEFKLFQFFTTGNNLGNYHVGGSAKGLSTFIVSGLNLRSLEWKENILPESRCEFGDLNDRNTYNYDPRIIFNPETCQNITVQNRREELCSFTCKTPTIPHIYCLSGARCPIDGLNDTSKCNHLCTDFVLACPPATSLPAERVGELLFFF